MGGEVDMAMNVMPSLAMVLLSVSLLLGTSIQRQHRRELDSLRERVEELEERVREDREVEDDADDCARRLDG